MQINYTAPVNMTGYGVVGMNLLVHLIDAEHEVAFWPLPSKEYVEAHPSKHGHIKQGFDGQAFFNPKAPSFRHFHQFDLAQHVGKGARIGSTVFELNKFNDREIHHLQSQDALCVATEWAKQILEDNGIHLPTLVLPHGVDRDIFHVDVKPGIPDLHRSKETVFVNIGKWEIRKGHDILIEAFNQAFEPSDNVRLVLACYNPFYNEAENKEWENLYKQSKMGEKVLILESRLALQQDVAALMASCDCGVFPARAEGWGLESLEMMSMGKQVILTDYAGHTEYANHQNSLLINPGPLEDAFDGKWFHGQGQWASMGDDQIEQLVHHMRSIHSMKQKGSLRPNLDAVDTAMKFSWPAAIDKLTDFLEDYQA